MHIKNLCRKLLERFPPVERLMADRRELSSLKQRIVYPPGHFYSSLPDLDEVEKYAARLFDAKKFISDVELHESEQMNSCVSSEIGRTSSRSFITKAISTDIS